VLEFLEHAIESKQRLHRVCHQLPDGIAVAGRQRGQHTTFGIGSEAGSGQLDGGEKLAEATSDSVARVNPDGPCTMALKQT